MRIMGLDVGTKTIGVAISDLMGWTAQPITTVRRTSVSADIAALQKLATESEVERVVIGMPFNMNGSKGPSAEACEELGAIIAAELKLPISYQDERLTTVSAQRALLEGNVSRKKRREVVDKVAAVFILQAYLDKNQKN